MHFPQRPLPDKHTYAVNGINIKTSGEVKNLGITLSSDVSWGKHMRNICGTA
jgi:hypothetical protein